MKNVEDMTLRHPSGQPPPVALHENPLTYTVILERGGEPVEDAEAELWVREKAWDRLCRQMAWGAWHVAGRGRSDSRGWITFQVLPELTRGQAKIVVMA